MKLKQNDRNLLNEFFTEQTGWMKNNSLLNSENLEKFKKRFLNFCTIKKCEENLACRLFELTLEQELLKCKEEKLILAYNSSMVEKISKVNLNYCSATHTITNNKEILEWFYESKIVCDISAKDMAELDESIKHKVKQNAQIQRDSYEALKNTVIK